MCTAATYKTKDFYMGRTLDYEFSYGDEITVTPRNYPFHFRHMEELENHYAIIGMAHVADDYQLYYDAVNEKGLGMAGLNFVENAVYQEIQEGRENVAQFEFIPWILSQCASVEEAKKMLAEMNLVGTVFAPKFPAAQLHWILADKYACITIECVREGLKVYDNPAGVLTNNPPFEQQMFLLNQYMHLSPNSRRIIFPSSCHYRPTAAAWVHLDFREIFLLLPALPKWHLPEHMQYREILRRKASASFSTFWDRWISSADAVRWQTENMRSRSTLPVGMLRRESTIIIPMKIIRSLRLICIVRIWTEPHWHGIH